MRGHPPLATVAATTALLACTSCSGTSEPALVADHPPAEPLTAFLERHRADPSSYPREQVVADHHTQPLVCAVNHRSAWDRETSFGGRV